MNSGAVTSILGALRLRPQSVTTVHIEGSSVRLLVVKDKQITSWGIEPLEPGLVRDGVVADPKAVGRHISALFAAQHVGRSNLVAGLTGQRCVPRILEFPQVNPRLLTEAITREMKREMPVPLDETHLSWQIIRRDNDHLRVFALGVPRDLLVPQMEAIRLAGGKLRSMDIKPLALVRAIGRAEALIADLEPESLDIIVVRGGIPAAIRMVSLQREIETMEDKVRRLGEELARAVKFYNDTHQEEPLQPETPTYLTGSLAEAAASAGVAEALAGHPAEPLPSPLHHPGDLPLAAFMVNIGLALKER